MKQRWVGYKLPYKFKNQEDPTFQKAIVCLLYNSVKFSCEDHNEFNAFMAKIMYQIYEYNTALHFIEKDISLLNGSHQQQLFKLHFNKFKILFSQTKDQLALLSAEECLKLFPFAEEADEAKVEEILQFMNENETKPKMKSACTDLLH